MDSNKPEDLRSFILNNNEPFIIKNKLNWDILSWSLDKWKTLLKDEKLPFRCGTISFTREPQWERTTNIKTITFEEFLTFIRNQNDEWMYFDYKYLKEWFSNIPEIRKNISWDLFGFPELMSEDSTIWIGSKGAHTPCHVDTYGCNLVAQIYGRKQWILCPPEENLNATRIPYEESSIYSKLNFFSPNSEDFEAIKNCRKVILEAGDVLFVPHKWWHYVENLGTAISVNVWIPLPSDNQERLNESIVQMFMSQILKDVSSEMKTVILNPNSVEEMKNVTLDSSLSLVDKCRKLLQELDQYKKDSNKSIYTNLNVQNQIDYSFIEKIPILSNEEFKCFLQAQRSRLPSTVDCNKNNNSNDALKLIDAFVHPEVVSLIRNKMMNS